MDRYSAQRPPDRGRAVIRESGADIDDAMDAIEASRVVDIGSINGPAIVENSPHLQAADGPIDSVVVTVVPSPDETGRKVCSIRGQLFDAVVAGRTIATRTSQPPVDGCRFLLAEGIDPRIQIVMRRIDQDHDALRSNVGAAARLTVKDDSCGKPVLRNWEAYRRPPAVPVTPPMRQTEEAAHPPAPDTPASPDASYPGGDA